MADPIIPGVYRAQVTFEGTNTTPRDRIVHTYCFKRKAALGSVGLEDMGSIADELQRRLREFYVDPVAPSAERVINFIPPMFRQVVTLRVYNLEQPPERLAHERPINTTGAGTTGNPLPRDVALCMSFFSHRNLKRRRGRIYLGPLTTGTLDPQTGRPVQHVITAINAAAQRLANEGAGDNCDWAILSPTDADAKPVTAGWCDNEWDTQRSRGFSANNRWSWTGSGHNPESV
jgi:hypothetical protein